MSEKVMGVKVPNNKAVQMVVVLIALGVFYGFVSWAIDSGSYWHYLGALVFFIVLIKLIGVFVRAENSDKKR